MATSHKKTPYELLDVPEDIDYVSLRVVYRKIIHDYKQKKISDPDFRNKIRAYETLSDFDKRKLYKLRQEWISDLPLPKYTAQQLAAEPALILTLQDRLRDATLTSINAQDPVTGHTILYCAARAGNVEAVKFLTEQGAEPDLSQRTKSTALHVASFYGHGDVVRYLLESGADYRIQNKDEHTAEQEAYNNEVKDAFSQLKKEFYVRAAANELEWFRKNDIDQHIDTQYYAQRQTLLHCASKKGHYELVRLLVEQFSADLDIVDVNGNSALHLACYGGYENIVDYLLTQGCNSTLENRWTLTAEQEGSKHGTKISQIFQRIRDRDMFEMARNGCDWWFEYYFDTKLLNTTDSNGVSLLYHACRYNQYIVAKWLLDHGANINMKLEKPPRSTPLHGAKYHGQYKIVELLLEYGADVTIKNDYSANVFDDPFSDEVHPDIASKINELLLKHRSNLKGYKVMDVHIYLDQEEGDNPKIKLQLQPSAVHEDLLQALPDDLKSNLSYFSIAKRRLHFDKKETTIISAVCRARYANSKFIETPLRLTLHRDSSKEGTISRSIRQDPTFDFRGFTREFQYNCTVKRIKMEPSNEKQTIKIDKLHFTFAEDTIKDNLELEIKTLFSADPKIFHIPKCICLFEITLYDDSSKLIQLPLVAVSNDPDICLYTLAKPTSYWFRSHNRRTRVPILDGIHAFVQHVSVIPILLTLPGDMIIATSLEKPLIRRDTPLKCSCLVLQEHDKVNYSDLAYHGTSIGVVRSVLADGLVVPGTVVAAGKRIMPPKNHIPRGRSAFKIDDFADAVFLSPSVHYSSDPCYAIPFPYLDQQLIPVLECGVKKGSYRIFPSTASTYIAQPGDKLKEIEWRVENPEDIVVNCVLFIPTADSIEAISLKRLDQLK